MKISKYWALSAIVLLSVPYVAIRAKVAPGVKTLKFAPKINIPGRNPVIIISPVGKVSKVGVFSRGRIEIPSLGIRADSRFKLMPRDGLEFGVQYKLGGIFDAQLQLAGNKKSLDSFRFKGMMRQDILSEMNNMLTNGVREASKKAQHNLNTAKEGLKKASLEIEKWKKQAQKDIDKWIDKKKRQTQWHINQTKKKIRAAKNRCKKAKWYAKGVVCAKTAAELSFLGNKLIVLTAHQKVTLPKIMKTAAKEGTKLASEAAKAGLRVANLAVERARKSLKIAQNAANVAGKVAQALNKKVFQIKSIKVEGKFKDLLPMAQTKTIKMFGKDLKVPVLKPGKLFKVHVSSKFLGKDIAQTYQLDFAKPQQFPVQVIQGLLKTAKAIKK